jgi:carbon-monoxide dehydrogenase medium subunit
MNFLEPASIDEVVALLRQNPEQSRIIAGGTGLSLLLHQKKIAPQTLISLEKVAGLGDIRLVDEHLIIGATATLREVSTSALTREHASILGRACSEAGNVRVQNQATLGGNLAEADYATDPPAALLALDASLEIVGQNGGRVIPISQFFQSAFKPHIAPDELLTAIHIPLQDARMVYLKYRIGSVVDRPCVGVAVVARNDGDLRIAVGGAADVPARFPDIDALANGKPLTEALVTEISEAYAARITPLDDLRGSAWYQRQMVAVHVRRALMELI